MITARTSTRLFLLSLAGTLAAAGRPLLADEHATIAGEPPGSRVSAAAAQDSVVRASVSFNRLTPDASISALARRHGVRVVSLKIYVNGMYGTHALRNPVSPDSALKRGRETMVRAFEGGRRTGAQRADRFLKEHTSEKITSDTTLLRQAESLVAFADQVAGAHSHARAAGPMVYGIMVEGERMQIEAMQKDPLVASVAFGQMVDGKLVVPAPRLPQEARRGGLDLSATRAMTPDAVLSRLQQQRAP